MEAVTGKYVEPLPRDRDEPPHVLTQTEKDNIYVATGFAHPELGEQVAEHMQIDLGPVSQKKHPNGEVYSRFLENVRGKHVFIIQSHIGGEDFTINDAIMQQCLLADAAKSSSASAVTAVSPYLAYMRQERKAKGREGVGSRILINQLACAGVDRIVTIDMHAPAAQSIFNGPFDHLTAQPALRGQMRKEIAEFDLTKEECIVVAPDAGAAKIANRHRERLAVGLVHLDKRRDADDSRKIHRDMKIDGVDGLNCIIFDDMIDTAGTLVSAVEALKNSGARRVLVGATHGIFSDPALERLKDAPIDRLLVTDTYRTDVAQKELGDKLRVVPTAPIIGRALIAIVQNTSISHMFDDQNNM